MSGVSKWQSVLAPLERDGFDDVRLAGLLRRWMALIGLILLTITWKLWTPQTVYPQVPFFYSAVHVPPWCDWLGFAAMCVALLCVVCDRSSGRIWRIALVLFAVASICMILVDQHRFQTWTYQFVVLSLVFAFVPARQALVLARLIVVSLYFHSAVSKFDLSFFDINGQEILKGLLGVVGATPETWPVPVRRIIAAALPTGELLAAVMLCIPRLRRLGLFVSLLMHVLLFAALGPFGLGHKPGVLLWNVFFIGQNLLLFGWLFRKGEDVELTADSQRSGGLNPPARCVRGIVALVILLPFLEPLGWFDHWPAWGLYASRPGRIQVWVSGDAVGDLPAEMRMHLGPARFRDDRCQLRIDRWSLEAVGAPIYPQNRYQLGVALAVARKYDAEILVLDESDADRWTGKRTLHAVRGQESLEAESVRYSLNLIPRGIFLNGNE